MLDDHQAILDGYQFRLAGLADIQVVDVLMYGEELEPALASRPVDVLILDINVPTSPDNPSPYPLLYQIPHLLERCPQMAILVISMHSQRTLVRAVMEAGASGYILKDDRAAIVDLAAIVRLVHEDGVYQSRKISEILKSGPESGPGPLTPRQAEMISYCAAYPDLSSAEIAARLKISPSTVRNLLSGAYERLNVSSRAAAIASARSAGFLPPVE